MSTSGTGHRVLGLGCGQPHGSAEILVKAALKAAEDEGADVELVRVDERVLKPRVAGFLAVGGSLTSQWKTLALPMMHGTTFSMHIAVVDQVQFEGAGTPRSVVLDRTAIDRAAVLGRNVASQLGVAFDEARYLGPPGLCPMCHLDVVALRGADVECATCGARGRLGPDQQVTWTDLSTSVISTDEKRAHAAEIQETAERHREVRAEIEARAQEFEAYDPVVRPPVADLHR